MAHLNRRAFVLQASSAPPAPAPVPVAEPAGMSLPML